MRSAVGGLCALLGVLMLVGGFGAYVYEERTLFGLVVTYPYRDLAIPLIVLGVVLIIAGTFMYSYGRNARKTESSELLEAYESDVRGHFPSCPICGSKKIEVHLVSGGRDAISCGNCEARWHIYVGLTGFKWAELDVEANDGRGAELLGKRYDGNEWRKMAQEKRKELAKT